MDRATDGDTIVRAKLEKWITEIKPRLESEHEVNTERSRAVFSPRPRDCLGTSEIRSGTMRMLPLWTFLEDRMMR